jgi:trigger factor
VDISVQDINSVDKEIIITANREDLKPKFDEAYKKYKKQIQMPGFRPGKVPLNIVRKRFGDEIEQEEVGKYVQEVFENEVIPEYEPVGEPEMLDLIWENDELEAKFKVGMRPEFELGELEEAEVDLMVHDVSDEEVQEELDRVLEKQGNWEEVEEKIEDNYRVTVDAIPVLEDGEPDNENKAEEVIDLNDEEAEPFRDDLIGHTKGDEVDVEIGQDEQSHAFKLIVKKVEKPHPAKLTDAFAKEQTDGEAKNVDEYKSLLKSRIQNYYDQTGDDLFKNEVVDALVENHEFEVPESFMDQMLNQYVQRMQQQAGGQLPPGFEMEEYKENMKERAQRDAKWFFINEKLQEKFDDIEIEPEDVDEHLQAQAAQYGVTIDQMRNMFAENPQQLESLRNSIREEKVFDRLQDVVTINEIDKETFQKKHDEDIKN